MLYFTMHMYIMAKDGCVKGGGGREIIWWCTQLKWFKLEGGTTGTSFNIYRYLLTKLYNYLGAFSDSARYYMNNWTYIYVILKICGPQNFQIEFHSAERSSNLTAQWSQETNRMRSKIKYMANEGDFYV